MPIAPGACWNLLERNTPPVKRRATHAKARTGCVTCKRRRVKCDEAKPTCARCIKSGHKCAGYEDWSAATDPQPPSRARSSSKHPDKSTTAHLLLLRPKPKSPAVVVPGPNLRDREHRVNLLHASLTPTYLDAQDALYFERFKCQMIADLGAWCGSEYWRHKILQEVLVDKTVQHAALGAAAMLMDIEEQQQRVAGSRLSSSHAGVEEILGEENAAIEKQSSQTVIGIKNTREEALPIVPLSSATAHGKAALEHYTAAISRCRQTLVTKGVTTSTARSSLTATFFFSIFELVQGNISEADQILSNGVSLLDHALCQTNPDGSPALVPDDELHEIHLGFDRMRVIWGLCPYFGSDRDACARIREPRHFELPSLDAPIRTKQIFWNAFSSDFGQFMVSIQGRDIRLLQGDDPSALLTQRTKYLTQLHNWLPILEDLCAQNPESHILCTTKVYAQTAIIFLNCFLDPSDLSYDAYLPMFKDIVAMYQKLLPSETQPKYLRLTLDVDLFHIITFTVSKCRDRETRAIALQVFDEMTRQQALWTNAGMLTALRALVDLEDKGRDTDGFVPASSRYHYIDSEWDFQKRQMMAVFEPVLSTATQSGDISIIRIPVNF
ncbi:hypothetical protein FHL15_010866 [Xylaria flabelliformis]|uniref:Zn(2)-C6 fungal-type domain-containing protein n=1 Tax=Xylaria flabelliformis TaxID=2512241 RepID=A0A553HJW8_9PEZI|nr:hypothetical protein FHL15_010866 [Xylaria flabelliformis]